MKTPVITLCLLLPLSANADESCSPIASAYHARGSAPGFEIRVMSAGNSIFILKKGADIYSQSGSFPLTKMDPQSARTVMFPDTSRISDCQKTGQDYVGSVPADVYTAKISGSAGVATHWIGQADGLVYKESMPSTQYESLTVYHGMPVVQRPTQPSPSRAAGPSTSPSSSPRQMSQSEQQAERATAEKDKQNAEAMNNALESGGSWTP